MPSVDKTKLTSGNDSTGALGIAAKTISTISTFRAGSMEVVDILCTDTNHYYIKLLQGMVELGGTADWNTGTKLGGR